MNLFQRSTPVFTGALVALVGLFLFGGDIWLVMLHGSPYYLPDSSKAPPTPEHLISRQRFFSYRWSTTVVCRLGRSITSRRLRCRKELDNERNYQR